jgi:hypothetical protein
MCLSEKAISEEEAAAMGGVPFSHPCKLESEAWIIENMIRDFDRAGWKYAIVHSVHKAHSVSKVTGEMQYWTKPALELWKIN